MNHGELVAAVAARSNMTAKAVREVMDALAAVAAESLSNGAEAVRVNGLGTLKVVKAAERKGFDPRNKKPITIPARTVVKFTVGKALQDAVKGA